MVMENYDWLDKYINEAAKYINRRMEAKLL